MSDIGGEIWRPDAVALTFNLSAVSAQFDVVHRATINHLMLFMALGTWSRAITLVNHSSPTLNST